MSKTRDETVQPLRPHSSRPSYFHSAVISGRVGYKEETPPTVLRFLCVVPGMFTNDMSHELVLGN